MNCLILPYLAQIAIAGSVAMRERLIEHSFNWEHIAPAGVGLTACSATCGVQGSWSGNLRRRTIVQRHKWVAGIIREGVMSTGDSSVTALPCMRLTAANR